MPDANLTIAAVRRAHERFAALLAPLDRQDLQRGSYARDWTIAQVASHLGSQAEIFGLFLDAGLAGAGAPGSDAFTPIWDDWNARSPERQAADSVAVGEAFVTRLERLDAAERDRFALSMFGQETDLAGLVTERLTEQTLHTWDIAAALDPSAELPADAVALLVDTLPEQAGHVGKPATPPSTMRIHTVEPARQFRLTTGPDVELAPAEQRGDQTDERPLLLPAAALIRLVAGRLDDAHLPAGVAETDRLAELRRVFPGF